MFRLFVDRRFMAIVLVGAFAHAGFYAYLVASPLAMALSVTVFALRLALTSLRIRLSVAVRNDHHEL